MEQKKKYKRRNYLINKPLQFAYAGIAVWLLLIAIILVGTFTYYITLNTILNQLQMENQLIDLLYNFKHNPESTTDGKSTY